MAAGHSGRQAHGSHRGPQVLRDVKAEQGSRGLRERGPGGQWPERTAAGEPAPRVRRAGRTARHSGGEDRGGLATVLACALPEPGTVAAPLCQGRTAPFSPGTGVLGGRMPVSQDGEGDSVTAFPAPLGPGWAGLRGPGPRHTAGHKHARPSRDHPTLRPEFPAWHCLRGGRPEISGEPPRGPAHPAEERGHCGARTVAGAPGRPTSRRVSSSRARRPRAKRTLAHAFSRLTEEERLQKPLFPRGSLY